MDKTDMVTMDLTNKVVKVSKKHFDGAVEEKDRLFFCESGFGCSPKSRGTAVFGFWLNKGTKQRIERYSVDKVVEMTDSLQARIEEIKKYHDELDKTCLCGAIVEGGWKVMDAITGRPVCEKCQKG